MNSEPRQHLQAAAQIAVAVDPAKWAQASGTKPSEAAVRTDLIAVVRRALTGDVVLANADASIAVKPVTLLNSAPQMTKSVNAALFQRVRVYPFPAHGFAHDTLQRQISAGKTTVLGCGRGGRLVQAIGRSGTVNFPSAPAMYTDRSGRLTLQAPALADLPPDDAWFYAPTEVVALLLFPQLAVLLDGADPDVMNGLRQLVA
ncbi:hypothetical protein SMD44_p10196 (plasmid) [Streptomyces alboflavus]|uniref:Uncharacterized protein n=1 Tax=Streptomyces alboflavus TaxID=67267 RepID=A0A291W3I8_9ACTN|nr:hypothetical protein [Streptomyces alboflavus]ATM24695.1 hypothetical protein SMD44_p10196 [Streptomyces alboflavus]